MKNSFFNFLFAMVCLLYSANASAHDFEVNGIYYNVVSLNELLCEVAREDNKHYEGDIVIPATVTYSNRTFTVVGISSNTFNGSSNLTGITIPNSIAFIRNYAFSGCI